jgi:ABC-type branched-subunit amino acid transport system substrate-binding protein
MSFFYQTGGSLPLDSLAYIKRQADKDLYQALINGEFCYVLTSRQMGKSSLRVQVMKQLQATGLKCSSIDLTGIGSKTVTPDQWYYSILKRILKDLNLLEVFDIKGFWRERQEVGLFQRLSEFVDEILLEHFTQPIVIFVDEIDSTISLPFSSDDFFAWIRSCYNLRADYPQYQQLTFCLLGVATPNDLIQDEERTPFNLGTKINLERFTKEQLTPFVKHLPDRIEDLTEARDEIHQWTGGQPYLTQKLCKLIQTSQIEIQSGEAAEKIGQLVHSEIITNSVFKDEQSHLATIRKRLFTKDEQSFELLSIYKDVLERGDGGVLLESRQDFQETMSLLLTGIVVSEQGRLLIYNRIYKQVFNKDWVEQELELLRPYRDAVKQWLATERDDAYLLVGKSFEDASQWALRRKLSKEDSDFLIASRKLDTEKVRVENDRIVSQAKLETKKEKAKADQIVIQSKKQANLLTAIGVIIFAATSLGAIYTLDLYQRFAYCPLTKGRPGEKIGENSCFRNLITSGEVSVFLSSINFQLDRGVKAFRDGKYDRAIKLFQYAVDGDRRDPVAQIFLNNAKARQRGNPLKLAVVASIDYYEAAAKDMLKGVADAQDEFNHKQGSQSPLLEIVIANDENAPEAARKVAQDLVDKPDILGVIGHHSSESTYEAQEIYKKAQIAVISPVSSSSKITGEQFFRTIGSTKEAAKGYVKYVEEKLKLSKIVVFYKSGSGYSEALTKDFKEEFAKNGGKVSKEIDINSDSFDIKTEIDEATRKEMKAALIATNVQSNSVAIAINKYNNKLQADSKLKLLGAMSLSEVATLEKGGKELEGFVLVRPCFPKSTYMTKQAQKWNLPELDWRTATSYDATKAFAKAITLSKNKTRAEILSQLQSQSFSLSEEETSGFRLKWDFSDRSNENMKYCVVRVEYPVEDPAVIKKYYPKFVEIPNDINSTPVKQK